AQGAQVLVLDDAYQLLGVGRDLNIAVVSAESAVASPWPLPAGPWREGRDALDRADLIVVTRKSASADAASALAEGLVRGRSGGRGGPGGGRGGRRSAGCGSWSVISRVCGPERARSLECSPDGAWWRLQGSPTRRASR